MSPPVGESDRLYRVTVKGGGAFLYDTVDVRRFAQKMHEWGDKRPYTVRPWTRWLRFREWVLGA